MFLNILAVCSRLRSSRFQMTLWSLTDPRPYQWVFSIYLCSESNASDEIERLNKTLSILRSLK